MNLKSIRIERDPVSCQYTLRKIVNRMQIEYYDGICFSYRTNYHLWPTKLSYSHHSQHASFFQLYNILPRHRFQNAHFLHNLYYLNTLSIIKSGSYRKDNYSYRVKAYESTTVHLTLNKKARKLNVNGFLKLLLLKFHHFFEKHCLNGHLNTAPLKRSKNWKV